MRQCRAIVRASILSAGLAGALAGCTDFLGAGGLPLGTPNPSEFNNLSGALQQAEGARAALRTAIRDHVGLSGELSDEMTNLRYVSPFTDARGPFSDNAQWPAYDELQRTRGQAELAREALRLYASAVPAVRGEMYAIEAYADMLLADLYCSGIPLSTIDAGKDFTYKAGSPTLEVYRTAAALFDTALTLAQDSARIRTFARVGWGRALLSAGLFDSAAHVVASVPDTSLFTIRARIYGVVNGEANRSTADREGNNGLPYRTSNDPRTHVTSTQVFDNIGRSFTVFSPAIYDSELSGDSATVVLASGVEARLIEAEADLRHGGSQWLTLLNALRTDGTFTVSTRSNVPGVSPGPLGFPDTTWGAGTGVRLIAPSVVADSTPQCDPGDGVNPPPCSDTVWYRGLAPLDDPAGALTGQPAIDARVSLLFQERAFWLFQNGHRQGDMRRLVRATAAGGYGRSQQSVYPTGIYPLGGVYGTAVFLPVSASEKSNPKFAGCLNHE